MTRRDDAGARPGTTGDETGDGTGASFRVLVMAKAPVAGRVKTRLGVDVGHDAAARIASAALLDTLEAATAAAGAEGCHLALDGDLDDAVGAPELRAALAGWTVTPQRGDGFAERLVAAHADAGPGLVVQVGMDTPHASADLLAAAAAPLQADEPAYDAVLGPADDGGWWVLARRDPAVAAVLAGVEMSTDRTGADTRDALVGAGWRVGTTVMLRDVDEVDDADAVAALAPGSHFATAWSAAHVTTPGSGPGVVEEDPA